MESNKQSEIIDPNRRFYVSVVDGDRYGLLLGPFDLRSEALMRVEEVRKRVKRIEPKSHFYGFGTCSTPQESSPNGKLNDHPFFIDLLAKDWSEFLPIQEIPEKARQGKIKKFSALKY